MIKILKKKTVILSLVFALVGISAFGIATVSAVETGSISVCKVIIDGQGNITDGAENPGSFVIPPGTSNQPMPTTTFSTPLNLNTDIIGNDSINDAECVEHSEIGLTTYYYGQEQVTGDNFKEPLYNDQIETDVTSTASFYSFDINNNDANGIIDLVLKGPSRTLVILNRYELPEPICGNSIEEAPEQCDDGNTQDGDGCSAICEIDPEPEYSPYCGDGTVNQSWEQCDSTGDGCTEQCQFLVPQQCTDLTLAKINVAETQNWGNGDMTSDLFLGSSSYRIPQGVWFLLYQAGVYTVDPDVLNTYEDVAGLAVQRLEGSLRTLIYGSHPTSADKEHVNGAIEFYNTTSTAQQDDTSDDNRLENGFDGTGMTTYSPGDDEVWFTVGTTTQATTSNFWLTVDVADDSFYTVYDTPTICEDPEPVCGNSIKEAPEQCDDGNTDNGDGCNEVCQIEPGPSNQRPVITVTGDNPVVLTVGNAFNDAGATAQDVEDGDITVDIVVSGDTVNTSAVGVYFINYNVVDSQGLAAETKTRKVKVNGNIIGGCVGSCGPPVFPTPTSTPTTTPPVATTTPPVVLGTTTPAVCNYLLEYLRIGQVNNPNEVRKLQAFLKYFEAENALEVSGIFDKNTFDAVSRFQSKYANDVLTPWGLTGPTGYVYITTKKKVNEIYCQKDFPLTEAQRREIEIYSAGTQSIGTQKPVAQKPETQQQEQVSGATEPSTDLDKISEVITDITSSVALLEETIKTEGITGKETSENDNAELNLAVGELLQKEMEQTDEDGPLTKFIAGVGRTTALNFVSWVGVILGVFIIIFVPLYYRRKDKKVEPKKEFTSTQRYPIIGNMPNNTPIK